MSLVAEYNKIGNLSQEKIITQYASMVKRIAHHLLGRLPSNVQLDDLIQSGMIGLLEAAKNYDPMKGAAFETYAGIRIRGTMLDEVRKNDWLPRSVYRNSRRLSQAIREVENIYGRDAKDHEIAEHLNIPLEDYHRMLRDLNTGQLFGFDDLGISDDAMKQGFAAEISEPLETFEKEKLTDKVAQAIQTLPERERLVLSFYYNEELNLKEIGEILGVSESRVCQIHSQAMLRLQSKLSDWRREYVD